MLMVLLFLNSRNVQLHDMTGIAGFVYGPASAGLAYHRAKEPTTRAPSGEVVGRGGGPAGPGDRLPGPHPWRWRRRR